MRALYSLRFWLAAGFVVASLGCGHNHGISLRDLERSPANAGQVVRVNGCYHNGRESTLLQPCAEPKQDEVACVVSRRQLEEIAKSVSGYDAGIAPFERPSAHEEELDRQLAKLPDGVSAEVVLRGELRSSPRRDFGTPPGCRFEFILHRVLSVSPR